MVELEAAVVPLTPGCWWLQHLTNAAKVNEVIMNRRLLWAALLVSVVTVSLLMPGTRRTLWPWLRGEPFYCGVPSSVWGERLQVAVESPFDGIWEVLDDPPAPWCVQRVEELFHVRLHGGPNPELLSEGPEAVPVLVDLLHHEDSKVRQAAASYLARLGPKASDAVPALARLLTPG
jgi:hypothetical protein